MQILVSIGCIVTVLELPPLNINAKGKKPVKLHLKDFFSLSSLSLPCLASNYYSVRHRFSERTHVFAVISVL